MTRLRRVVDRALDARVVSDDSPTGRAVALGATALVAVGCVLSVRSLDLSLSSLRLWPLTFLILVSIGLIALNAREFQLTSVVSGADVDFVTALRVTVLASAANVLPLPAGAMVRIQGLREAGVGGRRAVGASVAVALAWLAIAGACAGAAVVLRGPVVVGGLTIAASLVGLVAAVTMLRRFATSSRIIGEILLTEFGFVVNAAFRFHLVLMVLDLPVVPSQSVVLAASSSLASAVGIVPGAFGVAEGLAAALAAAVSLPASAGFLATALLRLTSTLLVGLGALGLAVRARGVEVDEAPTSPDRRRPPRRSPGS